MKIYTLLLFSLCLPGCVLVIDKDDWHSDGEAVVARTINITGVTAIESHFHGRLHITQGNAEGVRVRGKKKLLDKVNIEQKGDTLLLDTRIDISLDPGGWEYHYPEKLDVYVTVAQLDRLDIYGRGIVEINSLQVGDLKIGVEGGQLDVESLVARNVEIRIAGHGKVSLKGKTQAQDASIEGHGELSADELASETARLRIAGHGGARIWVTQLLSLDVEEHGSVKYKGNPVIKYISDPAIQQITASDD